MKTIFNKNRAHLFLAGIIMLTFQFCTEEMGDVTDLLPKPTDTETANKLTESLIFDNKATFPGAMPNSIADGGSVLADLKIDTDTIFWIEGITKRVKIRKPLGSFVATFSAQVPGSDFYLKGNFRQEEENDTVALLYFDFDPTGWELPLSFDLKIIPKDPAGTDMDTITVPVEIEEGGNCHFEPGEDILWEWISTTQNGDFYLAPMYPQITPGTVSGCCESGISYYSDCFGTPSYREVDYEAVFMVKLEYLKFFPDGLFGGEMAQYTQNLNPGDTDFCGGTPAYNHSNTHNIFNGTYTFDPGNCSLTIHTLEGLTEPIYDSYGNYYGEAPLPVYVGVGPHVEYKFLSRHFMKETRNIEGTLLERVYEARADELRWYD